MPFTKLGLSEAVVNAVREQGYTEPKPIQAKSIPLILEGKDLIGSAQTGTGKTAAFGLPIISKLANAQPHGPHALILEPTRELADQVDEALRKFARFTDLRIAVVYGGVGYGAQMHAFKHGVDILVATPGRLLDLMQRGTARLERVQYLVLDEADRMLDMGFIPDIESICSKLPKNRQTLLFSATMPPPIKKLSDKFLTDPKTVEVARPATANINIDQRLVSVTAPKKREALRSVLRGEEVRNAIIFCNRKTTVRELATSLKRSGFRVGQIHGDMEQKDRLAELARFKADEINILVASDVAARGLDIKGVSHVVNFDVPWQPDDYIHRIGRTGRAGAKGTAYTLATKDDAEAIANIEKLVGMPIPRAGKAPAPSDSKPDDLARKPKSAAKSRSREDGPTQPQPEQKRRTEREERTKEPRKKNETVPVDSDWCGPVPGFLSQSAL